MERVVPGNGCPVDLPIADSWPHPPASEKKKSQKKTPKFVNIPICSMYGIFTNIYPINHPNVGKYTIHGAYGKCVDTSGDHP